MANLRRSVSLFAVLAGVTFLGAGCNREQPMAGPKAIPVELKTLQPTTVTNSNEFVGNLVATQFVELAPKIDGRILKIYAIYGQRVNQNDPILLLEPTQQQEDVNAATGNLNIQQANFQASEANFRTSQAERDSARSEVTAQKANLASAKADLANAQETLKTREADLKGDESNLTLARKNYDRSTFLVREGVQPQQDLDNRTTELEDAQATTEAGQKTVLAAKATVQASQASVDAAQAAVQQAQENLKAAEERVNSARATIEAQQAAIQQARGELGSTAQNLIFNRVVAPVTGIVGDIPLKVGDFVRTGESFTTITNNREFELDINVPVERYQDLRIGLPVEIIRSDGSSGTIGRIGFISPTADRDAQSVLAKVNFKNNGTLRNNQYVRVRIIWEQQPGFLIPTSAVTSVGAQKFVFIAAEKKAESSTEGENAGKPDSPKQGNEVPAGQLVAKQTPVVTGGIEGQSYRVLSGVKSGDRIAVSRILELRDGVPIESASITTSDSKPSGEQSSL